MWNKFQQKREFKRWKPGNFPIPRIQKQQIIKDFQKRFGINVLIETGTYLGEMIFAQKENFHKIFSIEIDHGLYKRAAKIFAPFKHIKIIEGDSSEKLEEVLRSLNGPALFWLDGHFSGGVTSQGYKPTPVLEELKLIMKHKCKKHIILIDDAGIFDGNNGHPKISEIQKIVKHSYENFDLEDNIIRVY